MLILHCITEKNWQEVKKSAYYEPPSFKSEGFIHCSDIENFHKVAAFNFDHLTEPLLLLCTETDLVEAEIKWENGGSALYPHIYGAFNVSAVKSVLPYLKDDKGKFKLNDELAK